MSTLGERLKFLREMRNQTQVELGEAIGLGRSAISNYEQNRRVPSTETLIKLAKHFNINIGYIIGDSNHLREDDIEYIIEKDNQPADK